MRWRGDGAERGRGRVLVLALVLGGAGFALVQASSRWLVPRLEGPAPLLPLLPEVVGTSQPASRDIQRDEETLLAIESSREVELPAHAETPLRLLVTKSRARLDIVARDGSSLKTYPIALGGSPVGAKEREGDERTPEGAYLLLPHHESPSFGPCFYVCYPNAADARRGLRTGLVHAREASRIEATAAAATRPPHATGLGGLILLHATRDREQLGLTDWHWTLGCLAMENSDLEDLLRSFRPGDRPVMEIRP